MLMPGVPEARGFRSTSEQLWCDYFLHDACVASRPNLWNDPSAIWRLPSDLEQEWTGKQVLMAMADHFRGVPGAAARQPRT